MIGLFKRQTPPDDVRIYQKVNEAISEGRQLTPAEWNRMILATHNRIQWHEQICGRRWNFLVMLVIAFGAYEHALPHLLKLIAMAI